MSSRLDRISETDLEANARRAGYQPARFAFLCNVGLRQAERHFSCKRRSTPQDWIDQLRLHDADQILASGELIKVIAQRLCFSKPSHFSRWYKRLTGVYPTNSIRRNGDFSKKNVAFG